MGILGYTKSGMEPRKIVPYKENKKYWILGLASQLLPLWVLCVKIATYNREASKKCNGRPWETFFFLSKTRFQMDEIIKINYDVTYTYEYICNFENLLLIWLNFELATQIATEQLTEQLKRVTAIASQSDFAQCENE